VANVAKAKADIVSIESACKEYAIQNQMKYPESLQELITPDETGFTYLNKETVPKDPWGNEYLYEPPWQRQRQTHDHELRQGRRARRRRGREGHHEHRHPQRRDLGVPTMRAAERNR
jgi:sulfur carrier protein ThiS